MKASALSIYKTGSAFISSFASKTGYTGDYELYYRFRVLQKTFRFKGI